MKTKLLMMFQYLIIMTLGLKKNKGGLRRYGADKLLSAENTSLFYALSVCHERNAFFKQRFSPAPVRLYGGQKGVKLP